MPALEIAAVSLQAIAVLSSLAAGFTGGAAGISRDAFQASVRQAWEAGRAVLALADRLGISPEARARIDWQIKLLESMLGDREVDSARIAKYTGAVQTLDGFAQELRQAAAVAQAAAASRPALSPSSPSPAGGDSPWPTEWILPVAIAIAIAFYFLRR